MNLRLTVVPRCRGVAMVSNLLRDEINRFIREVGEPLGVDVEGPIPTSEASRIRAQYLPKALDRDEAVKRQVLGAGAIVAR